VGQGQMKHKTRHGSSYQRHQGKKERKKVCLRERERKRKQYVTIRKVVDVLQISANGMDRHPPLVKQVPLEIC
jgi:hypothetical protein